MIFYGISPATMRDAGWRWVPLINNVVVHLAVTETLGSSLRLVNTPLSPRERGDSMDVSDRDCTSLDHSVAGNAICGHTWLDEPLVISRSYGKSPCLVDK